MDKKQLEALKLKVKRAQYPDAHKIFADVGLIIDKRKRQHVKQSIQVITPNAHQLSWLFFELQEIFNEEFRLNMFNKYFFFPKLRDATLEILEQTDDLQTILLHIIDSAEKWYADYLDFMENPDPRFVMDVIRKNQFLDSLVILDKEEFFRKYLTTERFPFIAHDDIIQGLLAREAYEHLTWLKRDYPEWKKHNL